MRQEQKKLEGVTRREALKVGAGVLASVLSSKYLLLEARADSKKNANGESGEKMKTIPVEDMKKWDRETKPYRHAPDTLDEEMFTTSIKLRFGDTLMAVAAAVGYLDKTKSRIGFKFKRIDENEEHNYGFSLENISKAFKEMTGRELKTIRLIIEKGNDSEAGEYIQIYAIPNGEIKSGIPVLSAFGYTENSAGTSGKHLLLASAK